MGHAGRRVKPRRGSFARHLAAVAAGLLVVLAVLAGVFVLGRSTAGEQQTTARRFTGEVASFADDGRVLCVDPDDADVPTPFCDVYYMGPDAGEIEVGDRVRVRTLTSRNADGTAIAGILVTVLVTG